MKRALTVGIVGLLMIVDAPASSSHAGPCWPERTTTIVANRDARVYAEEADVHGKSFACFFRTGRRHVLDDPDDAEPVFLVGTEDEEGPKPKLAGRYVGFYTSYPAAASSGFYVLEVLDMREGKRRLIDYTEEEEDIGPVVLKRNGSAAWIAFPNGQPQILVADRSRRRRLDKGMTIHASYLRLSKDRKTVRWRKDGMLRKARLR